MERDPNRRAATVLGVGTCSGEVIVSLAAAWRRRFPAAAARPQPHWQAVDINEAALAVARASARRLVPELDIALERADLWPKADATSTIPSVDPIRSVTPVPPAPATFDLIPANLPYVGTAEAELLARDVRDHEPHAALFAGADGLDCIRRLIAGLPERLAPGGALGLEVGWKQAEEVVGLLAAGLTGATVAIRQDWAGIERLVCARLG